MNFSDTVTSRTGRDTVRAPDVAFVGRERVDAVGVISGY
jgi:hypothetical protein